MREDRLAEAREGCNTDATDALEHDAGSPMMRPMATLALPPPFEALAAGRGDAFEAARRAAREGAGAGLLAFADGRRDALDAAVVCEPETALARAWPAALAAALAMADALGAEGPPNLPVTFAWPDRILVNGALVGGVRAAAPEGAAPEAAPPWLLLGVGVRLRHPAGWGEPGLRPDRTALAEEGFEAPDPAALAEGFARHLLFWLDRWVEGGTEPIARHWLARRAPEDGGAALDPATGDLVAPGGARRALAEALRRPSWRLDEEAPAALRERPQGRPS